MEVTTILLPKEMLVEILEFAKLNDMNRSQVIRTAIREFLLRKTKQDISPIVIKYCNCGNQLSSEQEQRDGVCKECI